MNFYGYTWDLYKQSEAGRKAISFFEYGNVFLNDVEIIRKYNPNESNWIYKSDYERLMYEIGDSSIQETPFF